MKIAITGGAGVIGRHLTKAYLDAGHDVVVIDNLSSKTSQASDPRARFYQVDIRANQLRTILQNERPQIVSHHVTQCVDTAGEPARMNADVHIRGLLHVLDSCVEASVSKLIFASGGNTLYGPVDAEHDPLSEDTPLCPCQPVDISHIAGEWYVRHYTQQYGLKHTILRYADVYGETDPTHMTAATHPLSYFIAMLKEQRRPIIRGSGNIIHDHIFIDDVVQANLIALQRGENRTLHISSGQGYTLNQLYHMVALIMNSDIEPLYISGSLAENCAITLDNRRARRELEWRPKVSLQEGIRYLVQHIRAHSAPVIVEPIPVVAIKVATTSR
jgi:UDP-glucose 4-epimerase